MMLRNYNYSQCDVVVLIVGLVLVLVELYRVKYINYVAIAKKMKEGED